MPTEYTIQSKSDACIAKEEAATITISTCSSAVATGKLLRTIDQNNIVAYIYSSANRAIKLGSIKIADDFVGIPIEIDRPNWIDIVDTAEDVAGRQVDIAPSISYAGSPFIWFEDAVIDPVAVVNTGDIADLYVVVSGVLPDGISLNSITGALTGTPTTSQIATDVTIEAANAAGTGSTTINITVDIESVPSVPDVPETPSISYAGSPFSWTAYTTISTASVTSFGGAVDSYAVVLGTLPDGISLNLSTGDLTGTPTAPQTAANVTIRATNGDGTFDVIISITVPIVAGDYVHINSDGLSADLVSVLDSTSWITGSYEARYGGRDFLLLRVDSGGANDRIVEVVVPYFDGTPTFTTNNTADDTVTETFYLPRKIMASEPVEAYFSFSNIHDDGTNTSSPIVKGTAMVNNSGATSTNPSFSVTTFLPTGAMGPCVVSAAIHLDDFDAGDRSGMHQCEITWWLTGTGLSGLPDKYRKVADPDTTRNASTVDYTSKDNYRSIAGVQYVLTAGSYTVNCRVRNMSGSETEVTADIVINSNTRTVVWVDSSKTGGTDAGTSAANAYLLGTSVFTNHDGTDGIEIRVADGHAESLSTYLRAGGDDWWWYHNGTGTKPAFSTTGAGCYFIDDYYNAIVEGFNFIRTTDAGTGKATGDAIKFENAGFGAAISIDIGGAWVEGVGGVRFQDGIQLGTNGSRDQEHVLALSCTGVWVSDYWFSGSGSDENFRYISVVGCVGAQSSHESCFRTTGGRWQHISLAYTQFRETGTSQKSAIRLSGGHVFGTFRNHYNAGTVTVGATTTNGPASSVIRMDADLVENSASTNEGFVHNQGRLASCAIVNSISDGATMNGVIGVPQSDSVLMDITVEHCSVRVATRFIGHIPVGSPTLNAGTLFRGNAGDPVASASGVLSLGSLDAAESEYNVLDDDNTPTYFADVNLVGYTKAEWDALANTSQETHASVAFNANWTMVTPISDVPLKATNFDYYGNVRGSTSARGAVDAAP